jgi:hypothetical protein
MNPSHSSVVGPHHRRAARIPAAIIAWAGVVMLLLVGLVALDIYRSEAATPRPFIATEMPAAAMSGDSPEWPPYDQLHGEQPSTF